MDQRQVQLLTLLLRGRVIFLLTRRRMSDLFLISQLRMLERRPDTCEKLFTLVKLCCRSGREQRLLSLMLMGKDAW